MKFIFAVGAGSFIGGVVRYLFSVFIQLKFISTFPVATLFVNIAGCFLIGIVYGFSSNGRISEDWRLFLATGVLGGFTTFSAFSFESLTLLREGQNSYAFIYILTSVMLGLVATYIGFMLCKS